MSESKVYSPMQAALGSFIGGPLASVYFITKNFVTLQSQDASKTAMLVGGFVLLLCIAVLPVLPENFPNFAIPLATIAITRLLIEKYQFNKEQILADPRLTFHSNWRVFFVGIICLIVFCLVAASLWIILEALGIMSLA